MAAKKYLLIYRQPADRAPTSPDDLQKMYAEWMAWKEKFGSEISDLGDGLRPGGKVLRSGGTTDGPFIEAKEVLGGYSILQVESLERAVTVSQACPHAKTPGSSIEIRELANY